ncbi:MAG: SDR family NAD(P)-dependent oxidoreductase [Verrucomicrobiota bacterium]
MNTGKVAVVTGSTGGIGAEVSEILAANGWDLVLLNRSPEKAEKQLNSLKKDYPTQKFHSYIANMMDLSEVGKVVEGIAANHPELSALYHVAGILTDQRLTSAQGIEGHFAVNTVAPYLITQLLRRQLSSGSSSSDQKSVVVNFSSSAIKSVKRLEVSELVNPEKIGGLMGAYAKSKLAVSMVAEMLSEELAEEGTWILSADPGPTKTPMTGGGDGMPWFIRLLQPILFKSPEGQAKKLISAVDVAVRENASGVYVSEGKQKPLPSIASDQELISALQVLLDNQIEPFLKDKGA